MIEEAALTDADLLVSQKFCELCSRRIAVAGERFCKECRTKVIAEMKEAGYLRRMPTWGRERPTEKRELIYETKYGIDD